MKNMFRNLLINDLKCTRKFLGQKEITGLLCNDTPTLQFHGDQWKEVLQIM